MGKRVHMPCNASELELFAQQLSEVSNKLKGVVLAMKDTPIDVVVAGNKRQLMDAIRAAKVFADSAQDGLLNAIGEAPESMSGSPDIAPED